MQATEFVREVRIPIEGGTLLGELAVPTECEALVLFVNGRANGRHSVDDRTVARQLHPHRMATLLLDLLTVDEQQAHVRAGKHGVLDVSLLTERVQEVVNWIARQGDLGSLPLGLCGVAAGGTPALIAAARLGGQVQALVSVGGRPELAGPAVLSAVKAPTLLLVGSRDGEAVALHDAAYQKLRGERSLAVVPGGGALLEEHGVLEHAGEMAADWFTAHLVELAEAL